MKTLWVSDTHIGNPSNNLERMFYVLTRQKWDRIFLVGDIIDIDALNSLGKITQYDREFISWIMLFSLNGGKVYYMPGNHDRSMKVFQKKKYKNIQFCNDVIENGILMTHGDKYDIVLRWFDWIASWGGGSIGKQMWYKLYMWFGGVKRKAIKEARLKKCQLIICGHTHVPERTTIKGIEYINLGDWMGNSSWAEDTGEGIKLYHWKEKQPIEIV
jgi:UDP-2,3-diacylglucosamine pyrophosphatase LpxH